MKILLVGAGGVGSAFCAIAKRRDFFDQIVVADYDQASAQRAVDAVADPAGQRRTRGENAGGGDRVGEVGGHGQAGLE